MKSSRLKPLIFLAIPLAVGGLAALFSAGSMDKFSALNQPPLSPPGWLFPIVWGILYILMGTASYIVYSSDAPEISKQKALSSSSGSIFFGRYCFSLSGSVPLRRFLSLFSGFSFF